MRDVWCSPGVVVVVCMDAHGLDGFDVLVFHAVFEGFLFKCSADPLWDLPDCAVDLITGRVNSLCVAVRVEDEFVVGELSETAGRS